MPFIGVILDNKKFDTLKNIMQKNMNKNDITLININKKNIENLKNVKFGAIVIGDSLKKIEDKICYLENFCKYSKFLIINSDIELKVNILKDKKINIITYGLNHKSTITMSSITDENMMISIQRSFKNSSGKVLEVGEYDFEIIKQDRTNIHEILIAFIILNLF